MSKSDEATDKALDKATIKATDNIYKQINKETNIYSFEEFKKINWDYENDSLNGEMLKALEMMCEL